VCLQLTEVALLLLAAAPFDAPSPALHRAAFLGELGSLAAELSRGAAVNEPAEREWTPLHWAAIGGQAQAARLLLTKGANPDARGQFDLTPLHWAALRGHDEVVTVLASQGANLEARSLSGMTALHLAGSAAVVAALAQAGAKLDQRDVEGLTPLFTVRSKEAGQALLKRGADLHCRARDGRTLFDMLVVNTLEASGLIVYGRRSSGRLRSEEAQVELRVLNVWPRPIEGLAVRGSTEAAAVTVPPVIDRLAPGQLGSVALQLRREAKVAEGVYPLVMTVSVAGRQIGTFEIELDTSRA
jgi:hypothetical protein